MSTGASVEAVQRPSTLSYWFSPPEIALVGAGVLFGVLGLVGVGPWTDGQTVLRWALATMFLVTAGARLSPMRHDMMAMVPSFLPAPGLLVAVTGVLEALGAVGLLIPSVAPLAAWALAALLVAMFPANVFAARRGVTFSGAPPTPLPIRTVQQVVFIAVAVLCAL